MIWMPDPTKDLHLIIFNIVTFNGIILSMTFGMAHNLCRKYKYVVYSSYRPKIEDHVITFGPKIQFLNIIITFFEVVD